MTKKTKKPAGKISKTATVELSEKELGEVAGGAVELRNVLVSSYQVGTSSTVGDGTPDIIVGAGPGGGPHVK